MWKTAVMCAAVLALLGAAMPAAAEPVGAVGSRSAHAPGDPEEAQEADHRPRHGGHFGDADDLYHYEALLRSARHLILFVSDEWNRPLDVRTLEGTWTLNPDDPSPVSGRFVPSAEGEYFEAKLPPPSGDLVHVKVAVPKDGMPAEMEFYLPVSEPLESGQAGGAG